VLPEKISASAKRPLSQFLAVTLTFSTGAWPLRHGELLAEHEILENKIAAAAKQLDKRAEAQERKF
jgi:hypothetical protein